MRLVSKILMMAFLTITGCMAVAQEVPVPQLEVVDSGFFFMEVLKAIGGIKGLSTLAAIMVLIQLAIMFLKTPLASSFFKKLNADGKFLIVQILTIVLGLVTLLSQGIPVGEAILKTLSIPMVQEYVYQIYKKFIAKNP